MASSGQMSAQEPQSVQESGSIENVPALSSEMAAIGHSFMQMPQWVHFDRLMMYIDL